MPEPARCRHKNSGPVTHTSAGNWPLRAWKSPNQWWTVVENAGVKTPFRHRGPRQLPAHPYRATYPPTPQNDKAAMNTGPVHPRDLKPAVPHRAAVRSRSSSAATPGGCRTTPRPVHRVTCDSLAFAAPAASHGQATVRSPRKRLHKKGRIFLG